MNSTRRISKALMKRPGEKVFHVRADEAGQTVAALLRRWLAGQSWNQIERLVQTRHVQINGNLCLDAGRRLKAAEVVKVLPHSAAPLPDAEAVKIRHLDRHLVVVEKPSGLTSLRHYEERDWPTRRKQIQPTLDELLPKIVARKEVGGASRKDAKQRANKHKGAPLPLRPVHRLDRETSGLMVFARTVEAERHLGKQFRDHTIQRTYRAVVIGQLTRPMTISTMLIRDRGDGRRGSTTLAGQGKKAVTHVKPVEQLAGYTLIECRLETGRTHQIRIHLAEAGHPLCGEKVYIQQFRQEPVADFSAAPRIALHAAELGFVHPVTGENVHFHMPVPPDLQEFLARLRQKSPRLERSGPPARPPAKPRGKRPPGKRRER